jgi:hypothetical protein
MDPGNEIEDGGFPGPIGADQPVNLVAENIQTQVLDSLNAAEVFTNGF